MNMRHVEVLLPHPEPIIVMMAPRLRCSWGDYSALEWYIADLPRSVTFRVSGMIAGPEEFIERIAPAWGHKIEVWGPDGETPAGRVRRLNKSDNFERNAASLIDAHALWAWPLHHEVLADSKILDYEMITIAQELNVPVLLFMPEANNFEVLEL